jgi:hypothetical protein
MDDSIGSPTGIHKQDIRTSDNSHIDGLESVPEKVAKFESALNPTIDSSKCYHLIQLYIDVGG